MFKRKRKMALILTLAMVFAAFGCLGTAAEASNNLIPNGSFEDGNTGWTFTGEVSCVENSDVAQAGQKYLTIDGKDRIQFSENLNVEANTAYLLTFYYKCVSMNADKAQIWIDQYVGSTLLKNYLSSNSLGGASSLYEYSHLFGETSETAGGDASAANMSWKKKEITFTTFRYTDGIMLGINNLDADGSKLYIDNISLVKMKESDNLLPDGSFEYFLDEEVQNPENVFWKPDAFGGEGQSSEISIFTDPTGTLLPQGEHCLKIDTTMSDNKQNNSFKRTIFLYEGNYKLTYRHMVTKTAGTENITGWEYGPTIGLRGKTQPTDWFQYANNCKPEPVLENTWYDHTMYFTVPAGATDHGYTFTWTLGYEGATLGTHYYDDFVLTYDLSAIDFGKDHTFDSAGNEDYKIQHHESFNAVTKINNADAQDEIQVRAHYVPATKSDKGYTLISCVYAYDETANTKKLHTIEIANSDPAMNGKISTLVDTITVPKAENGITYKVEAFLWNSVNGLSPVCTSVELTE